MAQQSYCSDPRALMASSQRYLSIAPALMGNSTPLKTELAYRTMSLAPQPVAQLSACHTPSTAMDPSCKRRRILTPAVSSRHVPRGDDPSAKEGASRRTNQRDDEEDFLDWMPLVTGRSVSPTASDSALWKSGSTGVQMSRSTGSPDKSSESEFSPKSSCSTSTYSTLTMFSSADDSEPFDAQGETERLIKIHDLAEEIVAREAAVRERHQDLEPKRKSLVPSGKVPAGEAPPEALASLATSSLMPLAVAAGTSARASTTEQVGTSSSSCKAPARTSSPQLASCGTSSETVGGQRVGTSTAASSSVLSSLTSAGSGTSRRKKMQGVPMKSPQVDDPDFRGAVVRMQLKMVRGKPQLKMEHYFNNIQRRRTQVHDYAKSSDSDDDDFIVVKKEDTEIQGLVCPGKQCASCSTRLTPLWRDAEDGTPLCNACGIRYKKYKVRCNRCWHIPRKNENTRLRCKECGEALRFVLRKSSMP